MIRTPDELISPVSESELATYSRADAGDPKLRQLLIGATAQVVAFLRLDLINRNWSLVLNKWPTGGTFTIPSLSHNTGRLLDVIDLPYAINPTVSEVKLYGQAVTDFDVLEGRPAKLKLNTIGSYDASKPAIEVSYTAGFGDTAQDVPSEIRQAIIMCADYMYANGCAAHDALNTSGAAALLRPHAVNGGIVV